MTLVFVPDLTSSRKHSPQSPLWNLLVQPPRGFVLNAFIPISLLARKWMNEQMMSPEVPLLCLDAILTVAPGNHVNSSPCTTKVEQLLHFGWEVRWVANVIRKEHRHGRDLTRLTNTWDSPRMLMRTQKSIALESTIKPSLITVIISDLLLFPQKNPLVTVRYMPAFITGHSCFICIQCPSSTCIILSNYYTNTYVALIA